MIQKIYISSPYTIGDQASNVRKSLDVANEVMDLGYFAYAPLLSHFQHMIHPRSYEDWLKHDLFWLEQCDMMLMLPGESKGVKIEFDHAVKMKIPVITYEEFQNLQTEVRNDLIKKSLIN